MKRALALVGICAAIVGLVPALGTMGAGAATSPTTSGDLAGFSTGGQFLWDTVPNQERELDLMAASGAQWLRLDMPWPSLQPTPTTWNWGPFDRIIGLAQARGLKIVGLVSYTPGWAKAAGAPAAAGPADPATFAAFMRAVVGRYGPMGIKHWEIWNEPNQAWAWDRPDPAAYSRLLQAAAPAIRATDPSATIITAGLAPAADRADGWEISPLTFLKGVYAAGGAGSFDAVGIHPYTFPYMPNDPTTAGWSPFMRLPLVHDLMAANGDGAKQIWLTEFGAPTGTGTGAVSEAVQAEMVRQGYSARKQWSYLGPLFWYASRDRGANPADREQMMGLWKADFTPKAAAAVFDEVIGNPVVATTTTLPPTTLPPTTLPATTLPPTTLPPTTLPPTTLPPTTLPPTTLPPTTLPPTTLPPTTGIVTTAVSNLPALSIADASKLEPDSSAEGIKFTVRLSKTSALPVSFVMTTVEGTARSGADYKPVTQVVTILPGSTSKTVKVPVIGDRVAEPNEAFVLKLSAPVGATISRPQATATVKNDD